MRETRFKNTEVGIIPTDWNCVTLGSLGEPCMCKRILKEQTEKMGDVPFYKIGTFGSTPDAFISRSLFEEYKKKYNYPKVGDILISAAGTIGRHITFDGKDSYFQDSNIVWLDNDEKIMSNKYLGIALDTVKWSTTDGGTITRLYNRNLKETLVITPSPQEQAHIAKALTDIDALISTLTSLIDKKRNIKQGAMQELLSGKKRLPGYSGEWKEMKLGECTTVKARIGWQGLTKSEYLNSGSYFLVTGTDFFNGKVKWSTCHFVEKDRYEQDRNIQLRINDVLVTKDGTIGKVASVDLLSKPATLNSGVFVIRSKDGSLSQVFLTWVFKSKCFDDFIDRISSGSTISHLFQRDIVKFSFRIPPTINEQTAIANILSDMDKEISVLEERLEKYKALKQGMMQQLLTGKIRLI